jgi:hypothetical protein
MFIVKFNYGEIFKRCSEESEESNARKEKGHTEKWQKRKKVKSRKQAIAIGLSEARKSGAKVPKKKSSSRRKKKS